MSNYWEVIYVKYGDTLYQRYKVIYLRVVKDNRYDLPAKRIQKKANV